MSNIADSPLDGDVEIHVYNETSLLELVRAIAANPAALLILVDAARLELTKDARLMGNLLGTWAQKQVPPTAVQPDVKKRLS